MVPGVVGGTDGIRTEVLLNCPTHIKWGHLFITVHISKDIFMSSSTKGNFKIINDIQYPISTLKRFALASSAVKITALLAHMQPTYMDIYSNLH